MSDALLGICHSSKMQPIRDLVSKVAATNTTVLLRGESGVGKEVVARAIHKASPRAARQFLKVNCAALPGELLESELFGHEKGAFTGAVQMKPGKFELAGEGSIFLDEIGELSQNLQAKLLRVLQEREVERVGGVRRIPIKARILAATNRDLAEEMRSGRFREDLYQRLKVVTLRLPPLRERIEDIPPLVEHLLVKVNQRLHKNLRRVPREVIERLQKRAWPGNVRELENVLTRAAVLSQGDMLLEEHLVDESATARVDATPPAPAASGKIATLDEVERDHIVRVWTLTKGHKGRTCQMLGISRPTLERKLKKYRIANAGD